MQQRSYINTNLNGMNNLSRVLIVLFVFSLTACKNSQNSGIKLKPGLKIVVPENETAPVKFAISILQRDLKMVFGEESELVHTIPDNEAAIVIVNNSLGTNGSESQKVSGIKRCRYEGYDLRHLYL